MATDTIVSCESREEYDQLMQYLEQQGYYWYGGKKPTTINVYNEVEGGWGISPTKGKLIEHSASNWWRSRPEYGTVVSFEEYAIENGIIHPEKWEDFF